MHTFSLLVYIKRAKIHNGEAPIYIRITVDGRRSELSIKRGIIPADWNVSKGLAKGTRESSRALNHYIEQVRSQLQKNYEKLIAEGKVVSSTTIKNMYLGLERKEHTLIKVSAYHNQQMEASLGEKYSPGTYKNYKTTHRYLKQFIPSKYGEADLYLTQLNYEFLTRFEHFLKTEKTCKHNGAMKHIQRLKRIVNVAIANDWLDRDPFQKFKMTFEETDREFLSEEELVLIENVELTNTRLQKVRDAFVFSCYTGLAYSDVKGLTTDSIVKGIDGNEWVKIKRTKTGTDSSVPLLPKAKEILKRYKDDPEANYKGTLLPVMSNQKMNDALKEIAVISGITKNLHTHLARHTFATTVTLTNGVPMESVSSMLGHKSLRTTQIYSQVVERKVSEDMMKLHDRFSRSVESKKSTVVPK